jgi:hypothetical protein
MAGVYLRNPLTCVNLLLVLSPKAEPIVRGNLLLYLSMIRDTSLRYLVQGMQTLDVGAQIPSIFWTLPLVRFSPPVRGINSYQYIPNTGSNSNSSIYRLVQRSTGLPHCNTFQRCHGEQSWSLVGNRIRHGGTGGSCRYCRSGG